MKKIFFLFEKSPEHFKSTRIGFHVVAETVKLIKEIEPKIKALSNAAEVSDATHVPSYPYRIYVSAEPERIDAVLDGVREVFKADPEYALAEFPDDRIPMAYMLDYLVQQEQKKYQKE